MGSKDVDLTVQSTEMTCLWIIFLLARLLHCEEINEVTNGPIDIGFYYGVPDAVVDQILETAQEAGDEIRELGETFEPCFGDAMLNSTAKWIIVVVNSTVECPPASLPDKETLLLKYEANEDKIIVPDASLDLQETIRKFLGIVDEESESTPSSFFTLPIIILSITCLFTIALTVFCLLSKDCKRFRMDIYSILKTGEDSNTVATTDPSQLPIPIPDIASIGPEILNDHDEQAEINKCFKEMNLPPVKDTWTQYSSIRNRKHKFTEKRKTCHNCAEEGLEASWCEECFVKCHDKCKPDVPCIPKKYPDSEHNRYYKHFVREAPFIFTPLIVLVTSIEKRISNTRNGIEQVMGAYHYEPEHDNELEFKLSDLNEYIRTVRVEKMQTHYLTASLKELIRASTKDLKEYDISPLIPGEIFRQLCEDVYKKPIKHKNAKYIRILTSRENEQLFTKKKRDTLAYLMLHLYKVMAEPCEMDMKRICWELYPSIFGLTKEKMLEMEMKNPGLLKCYREVFMELLKLGDKLWRRFFIYPGQEKCTIVEELKEQ